MLLRRLSDRGLLWPLYSPGQQETKTSASSADPVNAGIQAVLGVLSVPMQTSCPRPSTSKPATVVPRSLSCGPTMPAGRHSKPVQEHPSEALEHGLPGEGKFCTSTRCGRRAARTVWVCAQCGTTAKAAQIDKLRKCSGCHSVRYCGTACQRKHWKTHKATCKSLQAASA